MYAPGSENPVPPQGVQVAWPPTENVLRGHVSQAVRATLDAVPAGQRSQNADAGVGEKYPASQGSHLASGSFPVNSPASQSRHSNSEMCSCPLVQARRHSGAPIVEYLPLSHVLQLSGPD